jgi:hypothetical protein
MIRVNVVGHMLGRNGEEMEPVNLKVVKVLQITQDREPAALVGTSANSNEQIITGQIPGKALHLDVDEILKRSLPNVSHLTVIKRVNKETPLP